MPKDKYSATWVSHTSLMDFLHCPRAYYLKNVYKDRTSGNKIQITSPALALGSAVHEVIESLSMIPTKDRFSESLILKFDRVWDKFTGKMGGFINIDEEHKYKERGKAMLRKVMDNPGPLSNLSVKIKEDVPYYWISEEENIILCGKVDWLEYLPEIDSVHIIDFKTSQKEEDGQSLQLPIYHLLVHHCQKRNTSKASYWYLEFSTHPIEKELPDLDESTTRILEIARKVKLARKLDKLECPNGRDGCVYCRPFEGILKGEGELLGVNNHRDIYLLPTKDVKEVEEEESMIL